MIFLFFINVLLLQILFLSRSLNILFFISSDFFKFLKYSWYISYWGSSEHFSILHVQKKQYLLFGRDFFFTLFLYMLTVNFKCVSFCVYLSIWFARTYVRLELEIEFSNNYFHYLLFQYFEIKKFVFKISFLEDMILVDLSI